MIPGTSVELTKINAENIKVTLTASKKYDFIISAKQYNLVIYFSVLAYVLSMREDFLIEHQEIGNYDWVRSLRSLNFFDFLIKSSNPRKLINQSFLATFIFRSGCYGNNYSQVEYLTRLVTALSKIYSPTNKLNIITFGFTNLMQQVIPKLSGVYAYIFSITSIDTLNESIGITLEFGKNIQHFASTLEKFSPAVLQQIHQKQQYISNSTTVRQLSILWKHFLINNYEKLLGFAVFKQKNPAIKNFIRKNLYQTYCTETEMAEINIKIMRLITEINNTKQGDFSTSNVLTHLKQNIQINNKIDHLFLHIMVNATFRSICKLAFNFAHETKTPVIIINDDYKGYSLEIAAQKKYYTDDTIINQEQTPTYYPITFSELKYAYQLYTNYSNSSNKFILTYHSELKDSGSSSELQKGLDGSSFKIFSRKHVLQCKSTFASLYRCYPQAQQITSTLERSILDYYQNPILSKLDLSHLFFDFTQIPTTPESIHRSETYAQHIVDIITSVSNLRTFIMPHIRYDQFDHNIFIRYKKIFTPVKFNVTTITFLDGNKLWFSRFSQNETLKNLTILAQDSCWQLEQSDTSVLGQFETTLESLVIWCKRVEASVTFPNLCNHNRLTYLEIIQPIEGGVLLSAADISESLPPQIKLKESNAVANYIRYIFAQV